MMKKIISILLVIVSALLIVSCGTAKQDEDLSSTQDGTFALTIPGWLTPRMHLGKVEKKYEQAPNETEFLKKTELGHEKLTYLGYEKSTALYAGQSADFDTVFGFDKDNKCISMSYNYYVPFGGDYTYLLTLFDTIRKELTAIHGDGIEDGHVVDYEEGSALAHGIEIGEYTQNITWELEDFTLSVYIDKHLTVFYNFE